MKQYKCGYSRCSLGGKVNIDTMVTVGNKHYHPECYKEMNTRKQIIDIFYKRINKNEVNYLREVVDDIIDNKGNSSEFLLYALCYAIRNKIGLHHTAGLYYIVKDDKIISSYKKMKDSQAQKIDMSNVKTENETKFTANTNKDKGWDSILGGG